MTYNNIILCPGDGEDKHGRESIDGVVLSLNSCYGGVPSTHR
jgi:hypothetical protein